MFHMKDGRSLKLHQWTLSEIVHYFLFLLLLPHCCKGTPQLIGSSQPILANIGDDVILPCHLKPPVDAATHTVEWTRPDLEPRFIHVWRSSEELLNNQNPWYVGRTSLFISELKNGNVSLKLSRVKLSDRGTYRCFIPTINRDTTVELLFGSVSSPSINISKSSSGLSLDCRSEGWFPQPEVRWLDAEGTVLSAGPTETLTGPDGLFTVSSRLNMEKTNRDSVTCRVHQEQINQTRETHLQVSADFFESSSSSSSSSSCVVYVSITVVTVLSVSVAAAFIFWKWRKIQSKDKKLQQAEAEKREREELMGEIEGLVEKKRQLEEELQKDLEEKKEKLGEELQKKEKEVKDLKQMVHELEKRSEEVHEQTEKIKQKKEDIQRSVDEIEEKFQSAEQTAERDPDQGFLEIKSIILRAKAQLLNEKQVRHSGTHVLQISTDNLLKMMKDRKGAAESNRREISDQLEEIQRRLSEHRQRNKQTTTQGQII